MSYSEGWGVRPDSIASGRSTKPAPSVDEGPDTQINFENQTTGTVRIFWIDRAGKRQEYASLKPGDHFQQPTYIGHVWLISDESGRTLGSIGNQAAGKCDRRRRVAAKTGHCAVAVQSGRAATAGEEKFATLWHPRVADGKSSIVIRDSNLFLHNNADGTEAQLSHDGKPSDGYKLDALWWSPDSKRSWRCAWSRASSTRFTRSNRRRRIRCSPSCAR